MITHYRCSVSRAPRHVAACLPHAHESKKPTIFDEVCARLRSIASASPSPAAGSARIRAARARACLSEYRLYPQRVYQHVSGTGNSGNPVALRHHSQTASDISIAFLQ
jgi:hypothetical protein